MSDTNTQNTGNAGNAGPVAAAPAQGKQLPEACEHTTRHSITVNGGELDYAATVGTILIDTPKVPKAASIFFTAFDLVNGEGKTDPARPVTFIFNGGPGSSTTFLLMGSIAPKRINVPDAAPVPAAPMRSWTTRTRCCPSPTSCSSTRPAPDSPRSSTRPSRNCGRWTATSPASARSSGRT